MQHDGKQNHRGPCALSAERHPRQAQNLPVDDADIANMAEAENVVEDCTTEGAVDASNRASCSSCANRTHRAHSLELAPKLPTRCWKERCCRVN